MVYVISVILGLVVIGFVTGMIKVSSKSPKPVFSSDEMKKTVLNRHFNRFDSNVGSDLTPIQWISKDKYYVIRKELTGDYSLVPTSSDHMKKHVQVYYNRGEESLKTFKNQTLYDCVGKYLELKKLLNK